MILQNVVSTFIELNLYENTKKFIFEQSVKTKRKNKISVVRGREGIYTVIIAMSRERLVYLGIQFITTIHLTLAKLIR